MHFKNVRKIKFNGYFFKINKKKKKKKKKIYEKFEKFLSKLAWKATLFYYK